VSNNLRPNFHHLKLNKSKIPTSNSITYIFLLKQLKSWKVTIGYNIFLKDCRMSFNSRYIYIMFFFYDQFNLVQGLVLFLFICTRLHIPFLSLIFIIFILFRYFYNIYTNNNMIFYCKNKWINGNIYLLQLFKEITLLL
jgi:hypothetical protein